MSDFVRLMAISFFGAIGFFGIYYFSKHTNDVGNQILTGFIGDHPIPIKQRWLMLYNRFVSSTLGVASWGLFLVFATALMANHVDDERTKLYVYFMTFLAAVSSLKWFLQGTLQYLNYRSLLREAEAA
jgi:hypothetical protein